MTIRGTAVRPPNSAMSTSTNIALRPRPSGVDAVDLGQACLRNPMELAGLLDAHSQPYSPPLPLAAIVEEPKS